MRAQDMQTLAEHAQKARARLPPRLRAQPPECKRRLGVPLGREQGGSGLQSLPAKLRSLPSKASSLGRKPKRQRRKRPGRSRGTSPVHEFESVQDSCCAQLCTGNVLCREHQSRVDQDEVPPRSIYALGLFQETLLRVVCNC